MNVLLDWLLGIDKDDRISVVLKAVPLRSAALVSTVLQHPGEISSTSVALYTVSREPCRSIKRG